MFFFLGGGVKLDTEPIFSVWDQNAGSNVKSVGAFTKKNLQVFI